MSTTDQPSAGDEQTQFCSWCGNHNIPNARYCVRCGQALDHDEATASDHPDNETTGVFEPIGTPSDPEATWANAEAEQTAALPTAPQLWGNPDDVPRTPESTGPPPSALPAPQPESARGLVLGVVASVLIAAVIGYYIYAAWISQSLRDDIVNWIP